MKPVAQKIEIAVIFLVCLIYSGTFWPLDVYFGVGNLALEGFSIFSRTEVVLLTIFLVVTGFLRRGEIMRVLWLGWPVLLLVGIAFLSAFWAEAPLLVLRRSAVMMVSTLFAFYLVVRCELGELVALLVRVFTVVAIASFAVMLISPSLGIDHAVGQPNAWRGAFTTKNELAWAAALGVLLSAYGLWRGYGSRLVAGVTLVASVILIVLANSMTIPFMLLSAAYAGTLAVSLRRRTGLGAFAAIVLLVLGGVALVAMLANETQVLAALNRSPSLTGRVELWRQALIYIEQRPWLGYGFGGFWRTDSVEANHIWAVIGWDPPHAHNGWLELGLSLGLLGIVGAACLWFATLWRIFKLLLRGAVDHVPFALAFLGACFVENLTESALFRASDMGWLLFVYFFLYLKREAARDRIAAAAERLRRRAALRAPLLAGAAS
ncbi:MAG TPA: O-antigen ligase family protein [Stellaceae bacterium]|nr:O-antigen ligase family protein [Stellaceae bacterium]